MLKKLVYLMLVASTLNAETNKTPPGVGVTDHRNTKIPLSLQFTDEQGRTRKLAEFFDGKRPVVLAPAYYTCPRLCTYVYNGLRDAIDANMADGLLPGRDFRIVSFSFNPDDRPDVAKKKSENYRSSIHSGHVAPDDWQFLTGDQSSITALTDAIGYNLKKDGADYSHPSAIIILTPDGTISRYMYGIEFPARVFRLSLVEASSGRIGGPSDSIMLFCFRYDDLTGRYTPVAWAFMRIACGLVLATLIFVIFFASRGNKMPRNR